MKSLHNESLKIGFIGFGEAVTSIAQGLAQLDNVATFAWYHRLSDGSNKGKKAQHIAKTLNIHLCKTLEQLAENTNIILNLTTSKVALRTAECILPYLKQNTIYVDLNSVGPSVKREIGDKMKSASISFVDGAIMAPVPMNKHKVPILASGPDAKELQDILTPFEMSIRVMEGDVGYASAVKMVRSIFMKSAAAITIETFTIAKLQGEKVFEEVFDSLNQTFQTPFEKLAERFLLGTMKHAGRRVGEVEEAIGLFGDLHLEPKMSNTALTVLSEISQNSTNFNVEDTRDSSLIEFYHSIFKENANNETLVNKNEP